MKKFFSKLQSSGNDAKGQPISDDELQQQLKSVQASLGKLKNAREEDFPLLNESTRLGEAFLEIDRMSDIPQANRLIIIVSPFLSCPCSQKGDNLCKSSQFCCNLALLSFAMFLKGCSLDGC